MPEPLVLASRSPQRRAILEQLGVDFTVVPADVEEATAGEPRQVVVENALRKARAVGRGGGAGAPAPGDRELGVDTHGVLDGPPHGEPPDDADAQALLR